MKSFRKNTEVTFTLDGDESLVLAETLQRLVEENEPPLLKLLHSSAEFAVLCRINNHLEKALPELAAEDYESRLKKSRAAIVKRMGKYEGIAE